MENPYQSPLTAEPAGPASVNEAETVRRAYINHEAAVKSIGTLMLLGGIANIATLSSGGRVNAISLVVACINLGLGAAVRRLIPWVRIPMIVLVSLGLLYSITLYTQIRAVAILIVLFYTWILVTVASPKGKVVFSPGYKGIIAQTPHVKYRTSKTAWIVFAILVVLIAGGLVAAIFIRG